MCGFVHISFFVELVYMFFAVKCIRSPRLLAYVSTLLSWTPRYSKEMAEDALARAREIAARLSG
jgi:hypothetical protein